MVAERERERDNVAVVTLCVIFAAKFNKTVTQYASALARKIWRGKFYECNFSTKKAHCIIQYCSALLSHVCSSVIESI